MTLRFLDNYRKSNREKLSLLVKPRPTERERESASIIMEMNRYRVKEEPGSPVTLRFYQQGGKSNAAAPRRRRRPKDRARAMH